MKGKNNQYPEYSRKTAKDPKVEMSLAWSNIKLTSERWNIVGMVIMRLKRERIKTSIECSTAQSFPHIWTIGGLLKLATPDYTALESCCGALQVMEWLLHFLPRWNGNTSPLQCLLKTQLTVNDKMLTEHIDKLALSHQINSLYIKT